MLATLFTPWFSPEILTTLDLRLSLRIKGNPFLTKTTFEVRGTSTPIYLLRDDLQTLQEQSRSSSGETDTTLDLLLTLGMSHLLTLLLRLGMSFLLTLLLRLGMSFLLTLLLRLGMSFLLTLLLRL